MDRILWDSSIRCSFSVAPSTYSKLILTLISSCYVSMACVCHKLWLLIILLIILKMFFWYPFSFTTSFILVFLLVKSLVICGNGICSSKKGGQSTFLATCLVVGAVVQVLVSMYWPSKCQYKKYLSIITF